MERMMFKSKIHRARVTEADLHYEGSVTIDTELLEVAGILPNEQVHIYNINNGQRFETYALGGERKSGVVCLNGAAARCAAVGDLVIIVTYALLSEREALDWEPIVILVDEQNRIADS
tara:strand:- start:109 stop:462 length:354 start_codon:yes stop_codon:yes gene_type:complete